MGIERRRFLQQTGLTLLTLGASQLDLSRFNRYVQTLAESTTRKLALLIGINQYKEHPHLHGCLTDVELQKELLIHRFNFQPQDILTLTETQATRENIETAFVEHLTKQASPTDVVVFHFSGYGSLVNIPTNQSDNLIHSLVPSDTTLTLKSTSESNDLLEQTLVLLAQSLPTDKITLVLDTSYSNPANILQGNLKVRSLPKPRSEKSNTSELAFSEQLQLLLSPGEENKEFTTKNVQQIFLKAAGENQLAVEEHWKGFAAGLFTYSLTQYLWETIPPTTLIVSLSQTSANMASMLGTQQQPQLTTNMTSPSLPYYLPPTQAIGAQGFISSIQENDIQVQLVGLPPLVLQNYGVNSCLRVAELEPNLYLQIRTQEGLKRNTKLLGENVLPTQVVQVGQLVKEYIRVLQKNLKLTVALDSSLERIERVDATSAFASLDSVSTVVIAGEQNADCLLGKVQNIEDDSNKGYGLFSSGGILIPKTTGEANEAVKSAINRLAPQLNTILATKLWRLTLNQGSSLLPVKASLIILEKDNETILQKTTVFGGDSNNLGKQTITELLPTISIGSKIQHQITNQSKSPIYFLLLGIVPNNQAIALYTHSPTDQPSPWLINPGETKLVPNPSTSWNWTVSEPIGINEIILICSKSPFLRTLETLANNQQTLGDKERILQITNPLLVSQAILLDLHQASAVKPDLIASTSDVYALDVHYWATLRFIYEVSR